MEGGRSGEEINSLIFKLGIRSTYQGFYYLQYALHLCMLDERYLLSVYKSLYVDVARKYNTSRDNVEHCIRTVVSNCWYKGNQNFLVQIAGYPITQKPTNGEFIDILYHYLKAQEN